MTDSTFLFRSQHSGNKCAWVISFTPVYNEPRVLRQTQALYADGWKVVVVGYEGHSPRPLQWNYLRLVQRKHKRLQRYILGIKYIIGLLLCRYAGENIKSRYGIHLYYLSLPNWRDHYFDVLKHAKIMEDLKPDLVISHDYFTCKLGYDLARHFNAKFVVDCHEYAREQYMHDKYWVNWHRPFVHATQEYFLEKADVVTTVCDGIAELLNSDYRLKRPVITVRSVPFRSSQSFRPVNRTITVLYHGNINHARGIHKAIKSMPGWRSEFRFVIRGSGDDQYIRYLRQLSDDLKITDKVIIESPVTFDEIIPMANKADIGYFVHENISKQKQYTLPNKFFEYIMAGLALCVSNLPEMEKLVSKYNLGKLVDNYSPDDIADTINSFNKDNIESYKRASLKAAAELNWDVEKQVMLNAYNGLL